MKKNRDYFSFFTADYRDGIAYVNGRRFLAGSFAVKLLNRYYVNETAGRIIVYRSSVWPVIEQLDYGYLLEVEFLKAGERILLILDILDKVEPFQLLDIEAEKQRIEKMFVPETVKGIEAYFADRAKIAECDYGAKSFQTFKGNIDMNQFQENKMLLKEVRKTLEFYDSIGDGMGNAFDALRRFVTEQDEAVRLDEEHLLGIAKRCLKGAVHSGISYEPVLRKKRETMARRMTFQDFYSFILTDFFEGLHYGHYPRKCNVCGRYFLMTSARRQYYCKGLSKYVDAKGKRIPCRKYAAISREHIRELAENNPITAIYKRTMNYIRKCEQRGKISPEFSAYAKDYAWECRERIDMDCEYLFKQYEKDMEADGFVGRVQEYICGQEEYD